MMQYRIMRLILMAFVLIAFFLAYFPFNLDYTELQEIVVPLKVRIVTDESGLYTSSRSVEDAEMLVNEANRIWRPAGIYFSIADVTRAELSFGAIPNAINGNYEELRSSEGFDAGNFNLFLVQSLNGINGLAIHQIGAALVADFTTVNDYRTTAHELGHLLGLKHVEPSDRLMARGRNGELLSGEEISIARAGALLAIRS